MIKAVVALLLLQPIQCGMVLAADLDYNVSIDAWSKQTGIVVTDTGKTWVLERIANKFQGEAKTAGFDPVLVDKFSMAMNGTGQVAISDRTLVAITGGGMKVDLNIENPAQLAMANRLADFRFVSFPLEIAPLIKIKVEPIPPRDYVVFINGQKMPDSEKNEYKPRPGHVSVRVTRPTKHDCIWEAELEEKDVKEIPCKM
ncbi:hypothetical protein [Phyllobacterium sp. P5_D12]